MSDFNKGDFTQQGVDGHVRATLRLNEKRYVELDLTTNENARGCTISGNVHDRLNNIDYPIGAAPSGNIAITENTAEGEPLDVSQYATATVNVAGGGGLDLLHTTVTIINGGETAYTPDYLLIGYSVLLTEFSELAENVLHTKTASENQLCQVDLSDLPISIAGHSSLTFNAYYTNANTNNYMGGIIAPQDSVATNMSYDDGWGIIDVTQNSTLTITVGK